MLFIITEHWLETLNNVRDDILPSPYMLLPRQEGAVEAGVGCGSVRQSSVPQFRASRSKLCTLVLGV